MGGKYRVKDQIEVIGMDSSGYIVQNVGSNQGKWIIEPDVLNSDYELVEEVSSGETEASLNHERLHYLIEALRLLTLPEDYEFREAIKNQIANEFDMVAKPDKEISLG